MTDERRIPAPREAVWAALNDPAALRAAIPGCERFEAAGENGYAARITARIGPVKAGFDFDILLSDLEPPAGCTISGEGRGGAAGFARGSATVRLREEEGETVLAYTVKAAVGGKLAQLGGRLIDGAARKIAGEFFDGLIAVVADRDGGADGAAPAAEAGPSVRAVRPRTVAAAAAALLLALLAGWLLAAGGLSRPVPSLLQWTALGAGATGGRGKVAKINMTVNGRAVGAEVEDRTLLAAFLRERLRLTGTHIGCDTSQCGACVVLVDGRSVKSCTLLAAQADGAEIVTIEGLADGEALHPMQQAFMDNHGLQCGFCTPGMIMSALDIVNRNGCELDEATVRRELEGNICRCTGYHNIVKAVRAGARAMGEGA